MARATTKTVRIEVRSSKTDVLKFLVKRMTMRSSLESGAFHQKTTRAEIRDDKGRRCEQISPLRYRCIETGEEFDET